MAEKIALFAPMLNVKVSTTADAIAGRLAIERNAIHQFCNMEHLHDLDACAIAIRCWPIFLVSLTGQRGLPQRFRAQPTNRAAGHAANRTSTAPLQRSIATVSTCVP
jgi:hypothetical protein